LLAVGSRSQLEVWDLLAERVCHWERAGDWILCLRFSPDGETLAVGCHSGAVALVNSQTGKEQHLLMGIGGPASALAFSLDGRILATANANHSVKLWSALTGQILLPMQTSSTGPRITLLAFARDGKSLIAGPTHPAPD